MEAPNSSCCRTVSGVSEPDAKAVLLAASSRCGIQNRIWLHDCPKHRKMFIETIVVCCTLLHPKTYCEGHEPLQQLDALRAVCRDRGLPAPPLQISRSNVRVDLHLDDPYTPPEHAVARQRAQWPVPGSAPMQNSTHSQSTDISWLYAFTWREFGTQAVRKLMESRAWNPVRRPKTSGHFAVYRAVVSTISVAEHDMTYVSFLPLHVLRDEA
eukprot:SAG11_NODE_5245_length_1618_cov_1.212640_1_plen_212_part_00